MPQYEISLKIPIQKGINDFSAYSKARTPFENSFAKISERKLLNVCALPQLKMGLNLERIGI
ncbi:hypothetical protein ES703_10743 [subsurface metagenome]